MRHMLKAMSFWVWGLLAIGIAVSVVPLSYRVAHLSRTLDSLKSSASNPLSGSGPAENPTLDTDSAPPRVSRLIAREMRDAQAFLTGGDWNSALQSLAAAEANSPLTAFDRKSIADLKGYAYLKLNKRRDAQAAYEYALATLGDNADAAAAFDRLESVPKVGERVRKLWKLYADTLVASAVDRPLSDPAAP